MRYILGTILALVAFFAAANCITNVIVNRDGTHTVCTTCCDGQGYCTTTCN